MSGRCPSVVSIRAPIRRSGSATRSIGRAESDSSPVSVKLPVLEGEQSDDQARERAGVAAVDLGADCRPRRPAPCTTSSSPSLVDLDAERAHGGERRQGVAGAPEAADARLAVRDGAEEQRAVRDRLVARHGEVPVEPGRGLNLSSITAETTTLYPCDSSIVAARCASPSP